MRIVDLTRPLTAGMPVYPGDPAVSLEPACTVEADGCRVMRLSLGSHAGTHLDAPRHVLRGGASLDKLPPERFVGRAVVADCAGCRGVITAADLEGALRFAGQADLLLLSTGCEQLWGTPAYFTDYPIPDASAVEALCGGPWRLVGMDCPGPDGPGDAALSNHRALLGAGVLILENLCRLSQLPKTPFSFCALPLLWDGADGAPARAIAMLED